MPPLLKWLAALLVLTGILSSWEPGPEMTADNHPHTTGHELLPPHGPASSGGSMDPAPVPTDVHYHASFDFSSETCTDHQAGILRLIPQDPFRLSGTDQRTPDSPFHEVELPPLI